MKNKKLITQIKNAHEKNPHFNPDIHFSKNLEKTLQEKAVVYLKKSPSHRKTFSFLPSLSLRKISFGVAPLLLFILLINFSFLSGQNKSPLTFDEFIEKASAAYDEVQEDILYQKYLEENTESSYSHMTMDLITEGWENEKNNLWIIRNAKNGEILDIKLRKEKRGFFSYAGYSKFLEVLRKNNPNMYDSWDFDFEVSMEKNFYGFINKTIQDAQLKDLIFQGKDILKFITSNYLMSNYRNDPDFFTFNVVDYSEEEENWYPLFTIRINKKTGEVKALNVETNQELTQQDYEELKKKIKKTMEKPDMVKKLETYEIQFGPKYYCFKRHIENSPEEIGTMETVLEISQKNPQTAEIYGYGEVSTLLSNKENLNPVHRLYNSEPQKLTPANIKTLLEEIKNTGALSKVKENGIDFYVVSYPTNELGIESKLYFDAQTYKLKKHIYTYPKDKSNIYGEKTTDTTTYLDARFIDQKEKDNIFNPDNYDVYPTGGHSMFQSTPDMAEGCYDSNNNKRLSEEESINLLNSIPPELKKQFEEAGKENLNSNP